MYKAFTEADVKFDLFGGTSGGGAMAAAFAMGANPTVAIFLKARALKRLTWPRYSLLDHTVFDRELRIHYGEGMIGDLKTGFFAVSTCLNGNTLCLITRGPVWEAVRAQASSARAWRVATLSADDLLISPPLPDDVNVMD